MKKLLIIVFALGMASTSFAQTFALRGGLNLANMKLEAEGEESPDTEMSPGFHVGGIVEIPLSEVFAIETGLLLSTKGLKQEETDPNFGTSKFVITTYNLDIPITAKAYVNAGSEIKIYFNLGTYLGYGLSGKFKEEYNGTTDEDDIEMGSDPETDDMKRFDFGLLGGAGIEFKSFQLGAAYSLGLADLFTDPDFGLKMYNRVLAISVGYKFAIE